MTFTACLQPLGREPPLGQISPLPQGSATKVNPLSLCASQRSGFVFYYPQRPCWHWVRMWWFPVAVGAIGFGASQGGQPGSCVLLSSRRSKQGEVKAVLKTGTISNKWCLSVNTYDLCAFSKPHMNIFSVLKTSLWSTWCSLSLFCGVGRLTGFKWDFKYLTAACSSKSFVMFEGAAIQIRQMWLFVYMWWVSLL